MSRWLFFLLIFLSSHLSAAEIDAPTGALRLNFSDHELLSPVGALTITRRYSGESAQGQFGPGWLLECASRLEMEGRDAARVQSPTGTQTLRRQDGDEYVGPHGQRLFRSGQTSTLKTPDGAFIRFDVSGREVLRQDAHGNQVSFTYDPQGRLTRVAAGAQAEVRFSYGVGGRIESLEDRAGRKVEYAYDSRGKLNRVKDMEGWLTSYRYDDKGRLSGIQYPDGASEAFAYDQAGRIMEYRNVAGVLERYTYRGTTTRVSRDDGKGWEQGHDADGRPLWRQDAAGRRETWSWSESGQLLGRCYTDGSLLNLAYDDQGRLISQQSSTGNHLRFTYDNRGRLQSLDRNGAVTRYQYDERGNVTAVTSPAGRTTRFEHDAQGRPDNVTDGAGRKTRLKFNEQGKLVHQEKPGGAATRWEFDDRGRLLRQVDPLGGVTTYHYQANGLLARVTAPAMPEARLEYDEKGRLVAEFHAGQHTEYGYDPAGRLIRVRHSDGTEERFAYGPDNRLAAHTDRLGNVTRWKYGADGRFQQVELPSGLVARYERNKPGHLGVNLGATSMEVSRQAGGKVIQTREGGGGTQSLELDDNGWPLRQVSAMGRVTQHQYDQDGLPTRMVLPSGEEWRFHYDGSALLDEVRFPDRSALRLQYDQAGRLSNLNRPWGSTISFRYDPLGRLIEHANGRGQVVRYGYDGAGRLLSKETPDGTWTYRYNERGDLIQVGNGQFTLRYDYDANGRLIKLQYPEWGQEITWQRDKIGRALRRKGPGGLEVRYTYDKLGRLSTMEDSQGSRFGFTYDDFGRLVKRTASNGTVAQYEYDNAGRVSGVTHSDANGKSFFIRRYRYDVDGNRVEVSDEQGRVLRFHYDPDGQLVAESTAGRRAEYVFGPAGNRKRMQSGSAAVDYRYDARGRLLQAAEVTYEYDADGQLAARRDGSGTTRYRFDAKGNLIWAELPSGKAVTYGYGPFGERLWREENGKRKYYLYDGDDVIAELSERFEPLQTFLYAGGDQPLAVAAPGTPAQFMHQDDLNTTLALTDTAGKPVGRYEFDSFGNVLMRPGDARALPPRFAGRPLDTAIGLYDMRARFYDPQVGRFISPDPVFGDIDDPLSFPPYLYARNNPWRYVDPFGEQTRPTLDAARQAWGTEVGGGYNWIGRPGPPYFPYEHYHDTYDDLDRYRSNRPQSGPTWTEDPYERWRRMEAAETARRAEAANPTVKVPSPGGTGGAGGAMVMSGQRGGLVAGIHGAGNVVSGAASRGAEAVRTGIQRMETVAQPYVGGAQRLSTVTSRGALAIRMADIAGEALAADDPTQVLSDRAVEFAGYSATSAVVGQAIAWVASAAPAAATVAGAVLGPIVLTTMSLERVAAAAEQRGQGWLAGQRADWAEQRAQDTSRDIAQDRERHLDALRGKAAELRRLRGQLASQQSEAQAMELEAANQRNAAQAKAGQVQALRAKIKNHEAMLSGIRGRLAGLDTNKLKAQQAGIEALALQACAGGTGVDCAALAGQAETQAAALDAGANPPDYAQAMAQMEAEVGVADGFVGEAEELQAALQGHRRAIQERFGIIQGLAARYASALQQARNLQAAVIGSANRLRLLLQGDDLATLSAIAQEASAGLPAEGAMFDAVQGTKESLGAVNVDAMLGGIVNDAQSHAGVATLYLEAVRADHGVAQGIAAQGREAANRARECAGRPGEQDLATVPPVKGMSPAAAAGVISTAGFSPSGTALGSPAQRSEVPGTVEGTIPGTGARLPRGKAVTIIVYGPRKGQAETAPDCETLYPGSRAVYVPGKNATLCLCPDGRLAEQTGGCQDPRCAEMEGRFAAAADSRTAQAIVDEAAALGCPVSQAAIAEWNRRQAALCEGYAQRLWATRNLNAARAIVAEANARGCNMQAAVEAWNNRRRHEAGQRAQQQQQQLQMFQNLMQGTGQVTQGSPPQQTRPPAPTTQPPQQTRPPAPTAPTRCQQVCVQEQVVWLNVTDGRHSLCAGGVARSPGPGLPPPKCERTVRCLKWETRCP